MILLAIDPGTIESAWLLYDTAKGKPITWAKESNAKVLERCRPGGFELGVDIDIETDHLAVEMIASYGMPAGRELFETCLWVGRFVEAFGTEDLWSLAYRTKIKAHICHAVHANDSNVRQALLDRWGGKDVAIGKKATPGPLYGLKADCWAALAVAVYWTETHARALVPFYVTCLPGRITRRSEP